MSLIPEWRQSCKLHSVRVAGIGALAGAIDKRGNRTGWSYSNGQFVQITATLTRIEDKLDRKVDR